MDRRQVIIDAAARRFAEFGFEATTVRQIAEAAKPTAFYAKFMLRSVGAANRAAVPMPVPVAAPGPPA